MKQYVLAFLATVISFGVSAQGINFETGTWKEVVAKAKSDNKLIYIDVFTTWCGPCKAMARNIFPNEEVGKKYNALFINFKTDAEKEGKEVAALYSVGAYPTNLYVNPHTLDVVYKAVGGCGVEEFIARADRAIADFNDPLSWDDYNKKLMAKDVTKDFIFKYIDKARRLGKNHDKALDVYMEKFISEHPGDDEIAFLVTSTTTYDNKAFPYLKKNIERVNAVFKDQPQFFQNQIRTSLFQGTYKKAIENKNIKILETAKPIIQEYSSTNAEAAWLGFMTKFYESLGMKEELYAALQKSAQIYLKIKAADFSKKNAEMLSEHKRNIANELIASGVPQEQVNAQVDQILNSKPELTNSFTNNAINTYNASVQYLIKHKVKDSKKLQNALLWATAMAELTKNDKTYFPIAMKQKAWVEYNLGKKNEAIKSIDNSIEFLKTQNKSTVDFENDKKLIQEGKFDLEVK